MIFRITRSAFAAAVLVLAAGSAARAGGDECIPDRAVVRVQPGADIQAILARCGGSVIGSIPSRGIFLIDVPEGQSETDYVKLLRADADVRLAECDFLVNDPNPDPGTQDFFFASTYGAYIGQPAMGIIGVGGAAARATGCGVVVAVLDSGIDPAHPAFAGRIAPGGINLFTGGNDFADVGDGIDNNANGLIDEGVAHGTLSAGLVLRLASDAMILPVKLLSSDGESSTFLVCAGLYHAIDHGADVINASLGTFAASQLLADAVTEVDDAGVILVASAGNDGNLDPVRNPAGLSALGVVAVAATDNADVRTAWSNYGPHVSICAPGVGVTSTVPGGLYGWTNGTSLAAPMVTGTLALLREACPLASPRALIERVLAAADPVDQANPGFEGLLGSGRLDAASALGGPGLPALPCRVDVDLDGRVDIDDLYAAYQTPTDVNFDGVIDAADLDALQSFLRAGEIEDMAHGRR